MAESPGPGSISSFMLDSRTPSGSAGDTYREEEESRLQEVEKEVEMLMKETRLWRIANSAQWVAWGIVQANIPELEASEAEDAHDSSSSSIVPTQNGATASPSSDASSAEMKAGHESKRLDKRPEGIVAEALLSDEDTAAARAEENDAGDDGEEEFDYLSYAQERAMFFWGDCVELGLVKEEELPEPLRKGRKIVPY